MSVANRDIFVFPLMKSVLLVISVARYLTWCIVCPAQIQSDEPPARNQPVIAYMDHLGIAVLFGGNVDGQLSNDTWIWNGDWLRLAPPKSPPARTGHVMAYDSRSKLLYLYGGRGNDGLLNDTWVFNGATWKQRNIQGPPARQSHRLAYDANKGKLVLFGGSGPDGESLADTWTYNGIRWVDQSSPIPGRLQHTMVYDPNRKSIVLFGGFSSKNGIKTVLNDTWELRGRKWELTKAEGPKARDHHAMAYDPSTKSVIMFGGYNGGYLSDSWQYINGAWRLIAPNGPARAGKPAMFYDYQSELLILYGGQDATNRPLSDFWRFEGRWVKD